jgi:hypothetical protein
MTRLAGWIRASIDIMMENIRIMDEFFKVADVDLLIGQSRVLKRNVESFIDLLEKRKAEGI